MTAREQIDEAARRRIESPCIGVCVIDPATDCCEGVLSNARRGCVLEHVIRPRAHADPGQSRAPKGWQSGLGKNARRDERRQQMNDILGAARAQVLEDGVPLDET